MACFGKKGSMLTFDNTVWCIKIKRQKKHGETFKETSRSLIQELVKKWPSSMLTRWRRRRWCGVVMEDVSLPARNCACLTFQYKWAKYLLHIPLYPSTTIISQSKAYANSIPKYKAMEYFKSIRHVRSVCICMEVQYRQTCFYTGNICPNLWTCKHCVGKLNCRYYDLEHKHNVRLRHTQPSKQSALLAMHPSHFFQQRKIDLRFPLNNIWSKLWSLRPYSTPAEATKPTNTNS